ncbi:MAG: efflux RND transporter periplasmic adaptor subunit [Eubacteriales bacterium]|nr:efflux RND transporter periplasmic adaptor subunit [Eubacteriales bacterium]
MNSRIKKHKKLLIGGGIAIAVLAGGGMYASQTAKQAAAIMEEASQQETVSVEKRNITESVSATGTVTSVGKQEASASVTGVKVLTVNAAVGDTVKKGDILAVLDSSGIKEDLADAQNALGASKEKNALDNSSAQRSLAEAQTERNIALERADEDIASAWNNYVKAVDGISKAEQEYADAWTKAENSRLDLSAKIDELNNAEIIEYSGPPSSDYEKEFNESKEDLKKLVYALDDPSWNVERRITLSADFSEIRIEDIIGTSENADTQKIQRVLDELADYQQDYLTAAAGEAEAAQSATAYQKLQEENQTLQAAFDADVAALDQKNAAIESAEASANSALDAYRQQIRSKEDADRNSASSIDSKQDSINISAVTEKTGTQTEEKSIRGYQKQIEECTVLAETSGVVTSVAVSEGSLYTGGTIITIEDNSDYEITTEITEYDINKIKVGQKVIIKTNGTGDKELNGKVKTIAPRSTKAEAAASAAAVSTAGGVNYKVVVSIDEKNEDLRMDMTAKMNILLMEKENVLSVPFNAIQEDDTGFYVECPPENTSEESGTAAVPENRKIYVTKGLETDYYVEISGEGITEGLTVLIPQTDNASTSADLMLGGF